MMLIFIYIFSNQHLIYYGTVTPGVSSKTLRKNRNKLIEGTDKKATQNVTNRIPCKRGLASYPHS